MESTEDRASASCWEVETREEVRQQSCAGKFSILLGSGTGSFAVTVGFSLADCRSDSWVVRRGMRPEASQAAGVITCILIFL